jgi:hypothetical protein
MLAAGARFSTTTYYQWPSTGRAPGRGDTPTVATTATAAASPLLITMQEHATATAARTYVQVLRVMLGYLAMDAAAGMGYPALATDR